eukprot:288289-Chlamydomonas_euryale.AAC.1
MEGLSGLFLVKNAGMRQWEAGVIALHQACIPHETRAHAHTHVTVHSFSCGVSVTACTLPDSTASVLTASCRAPVC